MVVDRRRTGNMRCGGMRAAVCACARDEGLYIEEWVDYHLSLGFDLVIIYDNNVPGDDSLYGILASYIKDGRVEIVDYRGRVNFQVKAYNDCLERHRDDIGWIAFIDVDEFLTFAEDSGYATIGQYLEDAEKSGADVVYVNWMLFGDSGKVRYEPGPVTERFTETVAKDYDANAHVKSIVSTSAKVRFRRNPHNVGRKCSIHRARITDDCFVPVEKNRPRKSISYGKLYLRHYVTKTIEEYIVQKTRRGAADCNEKKKYSIYTLDRFYMFNERTPEKDLVAADLLKDIM